MDAELMRALLPKSAPRRAAVTTETMLNLFFQWALAPLAVTVEAMGGAAETLQNRVFYSDK